jgi:hypothetical protein
MDYTIDIYKQLLKSLKLRYNTIVSFGEYLENWKMKNNVSIMVLRHDVDKRPKNSLKFAEIQASMGIRGSYYFRSVPQSWDTEIIERIAELGHEIGYHYETMDTSNGNVDVAWDLFRFHLDELRKLANVKTICMHGSPRSKYDNKDVWRKYNYRSLGISGEPYYDIDFRKVFYLTDTGRRWDGWRFSVRDKLPQQEIWTRNDLVFHSTQDIINAIENSKFPHQVMMTFHPQRWHEKTVPWFNELFMQSIKNQVKKYYFVK